MGLNRQGLALGVIASVGVAVVLENWLLRRWGFLPNGYLEGVAAWGLTGAVIVMMLVAVGQLGAAIVRLSERRIAIAVGVLFATLLCAVPALVGVAITARNAPFNSVYSRATQRYYALSQGLDLTDTTYLVSSTPSLLLPVWSRPWKSTFLDYSEDGSLTDDPRLRITRDGLLLVVERGGEWTDAVDLRASKNLAWLVPWTDSNRQKEWRRRSAHIAGLVEEHGGLEGGS